jgi:hypothetical protein
MTILGVRDNILLPEKICKFQTVVGDYWVWMAYMKPSWRSFSIAHKRELSYSFLFHKALITYFNEEKTRQNKTNLSFMFSYF